MKNLALALIFVTLCAQGALANKREWKDATVVNIVDGAQNSGVVVAPIGTMLAGIPLTTNTTLYQIETDDMVYILSYTFNPLVNWRNRPPNLTMHGKTKIAIDGRNAHVIDDEGKDIKVPIARKIARTPAEAPSK
jgi:hypothetical protein